MTKSRNGNGREALPPPTAPDKLMPFNAEAEESVLGSLLIDPDAIVKADPLLEPGDFKLDRNRWVYEVVLDLHRGASRTPADLVTVSDELARRGLLEEAGGSARLSYLINATPTSIHVEHYARIVARTAGLRRLINAGGRLAQIAFRDDGRDIEEIYDQAEEIVFGACARRERGRTSSLAATLGDYQDRLEKVCASDGRLVGIPTGMADLDRLTGGLQNGDMVVLAGRPSMGKCLGFGTDILMFDGQVKPVQKVKVDDLLMGPDSKPRKVLSVSSGIEMMYHVKQTFAEDYRVNESHVLSLKRNRTDKKQKKGMIINISLKEFLGKSKGYFHTRYSGYKVPIEFPFQEVSLPPYFLGLWLGDGDTNDSIITTVDVEVINYLHELSFERQNYVKQNDKIRYLITGGRSQLARDSSLRAILGRMGLLGNKHIPQKYLVNSKDVRLELLAGLIDSDGHLNKASGSYEITLKLESLIKQVKFLCDSLGYRTILKEKIVKGKRYFRLRFNGNIDEIPVKIPRKKAEPWTSSRNWQLSRISIEKDKYDSYYGFEIDGDGLFLLGDFTVTHNTSLALDVALRAARDHGKRTAMFSLEMSQFQVTERLVAAQAGIDSQRLRQGKIAEDEWPAYFQAVGTLEKLPVYVNDTPAMSVFELRSEARRVEAEHGLDLLIIDYLQLMRGDGRSESRQQEMSVISRSVKALARELDVPVLALSQLSRECEKRHDKRPMLSDLRESGSIEQDADVVAFLYREDMYDPDTQFPNLVEVIVRKNRSGPTGAFSVYFKKALSRFESLTLASTPVNYGQEQVEDWVK